VSASGRTELVAAAIDAFHRSGAEAVLPYLAEDVVWYSAPGWAGKEVYRGHDGVRELIAEWTENFVDYRWDLPRAPEELDDGRVLLLNRHRGKTREGVLVDAPLASVWVFRDDDLITEVRSFFTWEEGVEAAGAESPEIGSASG
jgi:ketosteroid isomerase-like protein